MNVEKALSELKSLHNEKTAAHNIKYGATDTFGVKLGDIRALAKKIKIDNSLAMDLWKTQNADAQLLACLIIDPKTLTIGELDGMASTIHFAHVADWFNAYLLKDHPEKETLRLKWLETDNRWKLRSAWSLTANRIAKSSDGLDLVAILDFLEHEMPNAPAEVQWTMNTALAYIGIYHPKLRERALSLGESMGIYRDFPVSKGCTSPFAPIWINEIVSRQAK